MFYFLIGNCPFRFKDLLPVGLADSIRGFPHTISSRPTFKVPAFGEKNVDVFFVCVFLFVVFFLYEKIDSRALVFVPSQGSSLLSLRGYTDSMAVMVLFVLRLSVLAGCPVLYYHFVIVQKIRP